MGTDSLTVEQIAAAQAKQIETLQAQLAHLAERLGPDADAAPAEPGFPKVLYKAQADPDPKQLDHPGWDALKVSDRLAYERAIKDGYQTTPGSYVYPEVEEQVVTVRKVRAKK